jgi:hypothetical protein
MPPSRRESGRRRVACSSRTLCSTWNTGQHTSLYATCRSRHALLLPGSDANSDSCQSALTPIPTRCSYEYQPCTLEIRASSRPSMQAQSAPSRRTHGTYVRTVDKWHSNSRARHGLRWLTLTSHPGLQYINVACDAYTFRGDCATTQHDAWRLSRPSEPQWRKTK